MKARLFSTASMLAAVAAASLLVANVSTAQGSDENTWCPGCEAEADPRSLEMPTPPGDPCDLIRFDFYPESGLCERPEPHPSAPCDPVKACRFTVGLICIGDCSGYVAGLFSLGGAVIPVLMPCNSYLYLGEAPCGTVTSVTMAAVDLATGAVAMQSSNLICYACEE
jgi:hypothetical protein